MLSFLSRTRVAQVESEATARPMGGTYPGPYDSGHAWRNWHPTARLLAVVAGVEAGVIVALAAVIVAILPLKTIEPVFLTIAPETKFAVEAARLQDRADALVEMQAAWVRRWIDYRFAVLPDDRSMGPRVLWLREHSAKAVYDEFESGRGKVIEAIRAGISRDVLALSVSQTGSDYWVAEFSLQDTEKGTTTPRGRYRMLLRTALVPPKDATRSEASRQIDAGAYLLGFGVVSATLSEVR
jgi:Type IV secretory pathway, component VirB8